MILYILLSMLMISAAIPSNDDKKDITKEDAVKYLVAAEVLKAAAEQVINSSNTKDGVKNVTNGGQH
uniref:Variable large protein n=1 Tax=Trichobilharzia regenti TaxID=157069 RepID=A0AA85JZK5_TRIRE|nr:unnamed protein product [Trichobilharzia regenti]